MEQKHEHVLNALKSIEKPWGIPDKDYPIPQFGKDITAIFRLNKLLDAGIKGDIMYGFRSKNNEASVDRVFIEFKANKIDFKQFTSTIFKKYVDFFEPYSAFTCDSELMMQDFDTFRDKTDIKSAFRYYPVFYWDNSFCKELLNVSVEELRSIISGSVETVELYNKGIFVILENGFIEGEKANEYNRNIHNLVEQYKSKQEN